MPLAGDKVRGVKVVLLHALPLDGQVWGDVAGLLDEDVVAPTLYRLGDSLRAWAGGVLDLAGPGPFVLVGNSVGGSCGSGTYLHGWRRSL